MSLTSASSRRFAGTALGAGLALACALVTVAVPGRADAAVEPSPYQLAAKGFGTQVTAGQVALRSAPTASSVIGCSKATGLASSNQLVGTSLTDQVQVGTVDTLQRSVKTASGSSVARSETTIASVDLGSPTLGLRITGLRLVSDARITAARHLYASNSFTFAGISPRGLLPLPGPLQQSTDTILQTLAANPIVVPGVGSISLGDRQTYVSGAQARANATGLRIHLYGADRLNGTADDSDVTLGSSYAQASKSAPNGLFGGGAWGVDATALGGVASVGRNPYNLLSCQGTYGLVRSYSLAGLDLGAAGQVVLGAMTNELYGKQGDPTGGLTGWTQSDVASLSLGGGVVQASGIQARASVVKDSAGRYRSSGTQSVGTLTVNGEPQTLPAPGQALEVPGVARIEVPAIVRTYRTVKVTALRITLLGGSVAGTVVNVGNAHASARDS